MDQALSSLFPVHQIGGDGFNWWVGQIESKKGDDPKESGRYRVRVVGQHLKDCDAVPTNELPWANVMMPVTTPYTDGLTTGASVGLEPGCWVLGFYLDNDKQKPIIMGSIGHTKYATIVKNDDPNPAGSCKAFTTFTSPNVIPQAHYPTSAQSGVDKETKANISAAGPPAPEGAVKKDGAPPIILAALAQYSETNPIGGKSCNIIANPKCGQEKNLKNGLTTILGDLLAANQNSGGQLGDYYVGKVNGFLYDKVEIARYHISRVTRLVRSFIARIKGEIIKFIKDGIEKLIKSVIQFEDPAGEIIGNTGPLKDPEKAFKPVRAKGNRLKFIKKIFDEIFKDLGCAIEDLTDRIVQFITDLIFGYLSDLFYQATCAVDTIIQGILNEILSLFDSLVSMILGPLQQLLGVLASPLNLIGGLLNSVMSLLGISCSGPSANCEAIQKKCTDCGQNKEDDLDRLIKAIEDGALDSGSGLCDESKQVPPPVATEVTFIGGVFLEPTPDVPSEPPGGENTPQSFFPGGTDIPEDTFGEIDTPAEYDDPFNDDDLPTLEPPDRLPDPEGTTEPFYSVQANKSTVKEGDTVVFTIRTLNVPIGTVVDYTLSGSSITADDIVGGELTGSVTMESDTETVDVVIAQDDIIETVPQTLTLTIDGTSAFATVVIDSEFELVPGINDDIVTPRTYNVESDKPSYKEGENIVYTITTTNVDNGTEYNYILTGSGIVPEFFINNSLVGTFTVQDNKAQVVAGINDNLDWPNNYILSFILIGTGAFVDVVLEAEETAGTTLGDTTSGGDTKPAPKIDKPVTGEPITDDNGIIISIPIVNPGDAFQKAPQVIITGKGYGATAIALLDGKGFVSEVRVTRTGTNYKVNTPKDSNTQCIIDSFTLISPGVEYASSPTVYVDGVPNIARAIVENGYVISVEILDRTKVYEKMPEILIIGGGGAGARVLPNLFCLDIEELERRGYAKIGTGKYIDCP
jgi:hypothetical protein